ncbi:hypothetical protein WJX82_007039 [Trebouxia sp. C0006]
MASATDDRHQHLEELQKEVEFLHNENQLLEGHLQRVAASLLVSVAEEERQKGTAKKKSTGRKKEDWHGLSLEEKNEIVSTEIEIYQTAIERAQEAGERECMEVATMLSEVDRRIAETKKDMYEFKRDVIVGAENARTGKTMAEKMIKIMEERLKEKAAVTDKLHCKNHALKVQVRKVEQQLHQKEDMGEVLHVVDFDQLKIENQQYLDRIEERNTELLRLKATTGKAVQVLADHKASLATLQAQKKVLDKETAERKEQLARFENDWTKANTDKTAAKKTLQRLQAEQQDTDLPQIIDYIKVKAEIGDLEKKLTDWGRKIEIAEMDQARTKKIHLAMSALPNAATQLL